MELLLLVLVLTSVGSALDLSLVTVSSRPVSGVLLLTGPRGQYQFQFSEASEACLSQKSSVASRSQLRTALDHGLEACRFGWIAEQVAAVPRLSSVSTCGSGRTGVVTWSAVLTQRFGVWCFRPSDSNEAENTTPQDPQNTTIYATTSILPQGTPAFTITATANTITTTTTVPKTVHAVRTPTMKPLTSTAALATPKPKTPRSEAVSTQVTTITSKSMNTLIITSSSTVGSTSSPRYYTSEPSLNTGSVRSQRQRVLSTALIVFCVVALVLSAGGAVFYYRHSKRWVWPHASQKDDIETETWKQTCSELELQEETETEGRRFSGDTTLYVNPDARTD